jgi:zinc protease
MRRTRLSAALLLLFAVACGGESPEGGTSGAQDGPILLPVRDDPTVSFCIWFQVGSQNDPPGKEGLAYVTGHLLAEGSTQNNSYEEILAQLYPLASNYGVRVDREMTTVRGRTHVDNLEKFYALFTDALLKPKFDEKDFERIRNDALNAIKNTLRYSSDEELGKAAFYDFVFTGTSYSHPREGTVQGLESLTIDDVRAFYNQYYTRENSVLALGGGYPSNLAERLQTSMSALPAGEPAPAQEPQAAAIDGRKVVLVSKAGADASLSFGFPIDVLRGERDFYALWVANSWLGEHRNSSSHLYQVIRSARGMNYGDYSYIEAYPEGGFRQKPPQNVSRRQQCFEIWIRTLPNEQAVFALRAAMRELQTLVDQGMSEEDFELTRSFLNKYVLHFAETTSQRLRYAVDDRFYGIDGSHLENFRKILATLTLEEVNAAIRKHLQYENMKIAIITGDADLIKRQLASDEATPMEYGSEKPAEVLEEDKEISTLPLQIAESNIQVIPVEEMFEN